MISKTITECRLCASKDLQTILELGNQPPANSLRKKSSDTLENVPLTICRCTECTTIQLTETIDPEYMFSNYVWVTGTSKGAREYSQIFADRIVSKLNKANDLFIVEVASNDGTFLQRFNENGHCVLGIDPAKNLAESAKKNGIPTIVAFFGLNVAKQVTGSHGQADIVIARNVIPHVPDPNDVVSGMANCLKEDGVGAIEFHWIDKILSGLHYDSIYHEHFFYHSLHSINELLLRHGLNLFDVAESPISGGSLVAFFSKEKRDITHELEEKLKWEDEQGIASLKAWQEFAKKSFQHRDKLKSIIELEKSAGKKVIGYGASARSSTLLNFCDINNNHLICIADQNPFKHNRYTPGTDIPIASPDEALKGNPDTVVILAWNFKDEIINDLKEKGFKGNIIIPLPNAPYLLEI
jgi:SAM-dependent methyltransferase